MKHHETNTLSDAVEPATSIQPRLASIGRVCEILDISRPTALRMIKRGELRSVRVGPRLVRVDLASVDDLLGRSCGGAA
jgi:excisionase family DNA binding protein